MGFCLMSTGFGEIRANSLEIAANLCLFLSEITFENNQKERSIKEKALDQRLKKPKYGLFQGINHRFEGYIWVLFPKNEE